LQSCEIRGIIEWDDEDGEHREIVVRDTNNQLYVSFEVNPNANLVLEVVKELDVEKDQVILPKHVKEGVKRV